VPGTEIRVSRSLGQSRPEMKAFSFSEVQMKRKCLFLVIVLLNYFFGKNIVAFLFEILWKTGSW